ncbi:hypothetical protein CEXT_160761, partial [Caerostris extrusa]
DYLENLDGLWMIWKILMAHVNDLENVDGMSMIFR